MITTGGTVALAEGIIDATCLVNFIFRVATTIAKAPLSDEFRSIVDVDESGTETCGSLDVGNHELSFKDCDSNAQPAICQSKCARNVLLISCKVL